MSYFRVCPYCGACLDPGEKCDCKEKAAPELEPPCAAQAKNLTETISNQNYFVKEG